MFSNRGLRFRVLTIGIILTLVPLVLVCVGMWWQERKMEQVASQGCQELAYTDLDHIARSVVSTCTVMQQEADGFLRFAGKFTDQALSRLGAVKISGDQKIAWSARNQVSQDVTNVHLGKMTLGSTGLEPNFDPKKAAPVVDEVGKSLGVLCTIFQRMNEKGDMIRICTNVVGKDGRRAVGTYIPAVNSDGTPSEVIAAVLQGKTYHGRALVVDKWCNTAYRPMRDAGGNLVGMVFVGSPEGTVTANFRKAIQEIKVGKTGYVYVLNAAGAAQGTYVVSKDGKRDGENIWGVKDSSGRLFVQEICTQARNLGDGQVMEYRHPWKNADDPAPRMKVDRIMYYKPWDWVVGVGSYEDEFFQAANMVKALAAKGRLINMILGGAICALSLLIWYFVSTRLVRRIAGTVSQLSDGAHRMADVSNQIAASSQTQAQGTSEQASSLEETSSALEEMAGMANTNSENAAKANDLMSQTTQVVGQSQNVMKQTSEAMEKVNDASGKIAKIIKVIEEIAFQTNLLALNAAVEAARAGEHGKGFAVVADEVRNLAQRSAQAANETGQLISDTIERVKKGTELNGELSESFTKVNASSMKVAQLVEQIAQASQDQAKGVEQINAAVSQMDKVVQQSAAGSEESASVALDLSSQAEALRQSVNDLGTIIGQQHLAKRETGNTPQPGQIPERPTINKVSAGPKAAMSKGKVNDF